MRPIRGLPLLVAAIVGLTVYFVALRDAGAVPSFARKYQTSCQTCHTVFPVLNPFGEAFRRNGYRFPSQNGSEDSDSIKANQLPLGQEEYKKTFPDSVWPDKIMDAIPLSLMINGAVPINLPGSAAKEEAGSIFPWSGIVAEGHFFVAGALNDTLTYMTQITMDFEAGSVDLETAYLLWNDIVGPRHLFNVWVGRLWAPQLTSFGLHSDYLADTVTPATAVAALYNPSGAFTLGQGHTDGVELNGIAKHRFNYALGWVASSAAGAPLPGASGLTQPNAEDVYVHVGVKSGGVALDGEGKYGPNVPDPRKPWAEKAITFDLFAYHGLTRLDNGTGVAPNQVQQDDRFNAVGAVIHAQWDSIVLMAGAQLERHDSPYTGTPGQTAGTTTFNGTPNLKPATTILQFSELDYIVWPWFVPGVRTELTNAEVAGGPDAQLLRIIPGIAILVRPNIKVVLSGDLEWGHNLPYVGSWSPSGAGVVSTANTSKFEAEQINAAVAVAY
jgi:hypothetical protein